MKTLSGDLIALARDGAFDVIAHVCNCMCTMGAGIAVSVRHTWPEAYAADLATEKGDRGKLGTCTQAQMGAVTVVNAYNHYDYKGRGVKADYDAIRSCMAWIRKVHTGKRVGLPKMGAGPAGGDWERISAIIAEELAGEDVTIVEFIGS